MANDIITQLQARNETLTQAIARYGSLNASTLHTLSFEQTKVTRLTQQLANSALRREENDKQRAGLLEKTQTFAGQLGKLLNVETPDWKLPYEFQGNMVDMAAKGGMDNTARDALSLNIRDWSLDFNQDQKDLQSTAATMIEGGVSEFRPFPEIRLLERDGQLVCPPGRGSSGIAAGASAKWDRRDGSDDPHRADATGENEPADPRHLQANHED